MPLQFCQVSHCARSLGVALLTSIAIHAPTSLAQDDPVTTAPGQLKTSPEALLQMSKSTSTTTAQKVLATLIAEDFEQTSSPWISEGSWQIGPPASGPNSGYNSAGAAGSNLAGAYDNNANDSLVSPLIELPQLAEGDSLTLSFREFYDLESELDFGFIELSSDGGLTWATTLSTRTGSSAGTWLEGEIDLSQYAGSGIQLRFRLSSNDSVTFDGWYLDDIAVTQDTPDLIAARLRAINSQLFPFIFSDLEFASQAEACIEPLAIDEFTLFEDGIEQELISFVPPEEGGGIRLADVVFIFDNSGSMGDEQAAVETNIISFVDGLVSSGVDFALGLTRYGQSANSGFAIIEDNGVLTTDPEYFKNTVLPRNVASGGNEPGYDAIGTTTGSFAFRPGSQRVIIIITDETPDQGNATIADAANALASVDAQLYAVTSSSLFGFFEPLVEDPATQLIDILSPFDIILDAIEANIGSTYRLSYRTSNDIIDGIERLVEVEVTCASEITIADGTYTPGAAPQISRAPETILLSSTGQEPNLGLEITAEVTDALAPFVSEVTLFYRSIGGVFTSTSMQRVSSEIDAPPSDFYTAQIPAEAVTTPGIEYYISATDSEITSSLPSVDPISNPFQIAVLPNEPPRVVHSDVVMSLPDVTIAISAEVTDDTNIVSSVELFYRRTGELSYQRSGMPLLAEAQPPVYGTEIPAEFVTELGVQYYIKATDDNEVATSVGTPDAPIEITVAVPVVTQITLLEETIEAVAGEELCLNALVEDQFDQPMPGVEVSFSIPLADSVFTGVAISDDQGIAELCITVPVEADETSVDVTLQSDDVVTETTEEIIIEFIPQLTNIELLTDNIEVIEDEEVCLDAEVVDQRGNPVTNTLINFDVSIGTSSFTGSALSNAEGIAQYCFIVPENTSGRELMVRFSADEFNKEVGTDITIIEKSVDISGNINSGSGSTGGIGLFIMIILLARKYRTALSRAVTVTCAVLGAAISGSASAEFGWYAGTKVGTAEYIDVDRSIANTINQADGDVGFSIDDSTTGYVIYGGYQFLGWLALEASYLDMDEYSAKLSGSVDEPETLAADLVKDITPSVEGIGLGISALWSPVEKLSVRPNAGAFFYDVEKEVSINEFSFQQDDSGIGYYGGVNVMYPIKPELNIGFAYDTYWNEDNDRVAELFSVQLEYTFGL